MEQKKENSKLLWKCLKIKWYLIAFLIIKGLSTVFFDKEFVGESEQWRAFDSSSISKEALNLFMENEQALSRENCK